MSCKHLLKPLALSFRNLKYRYMQPHVSYAAFSYLHSLSYQNLKHFSKINKCEYVPSVNFQTSNKYYDSSEEEDLSKPLVKLTFITPEGKELHAEGRVGLSVMQVAVKNNIPMAAVCRGKLSCTTCHVYVEQNTKMMLEYAATEEHESLDLVPFVKPNSRLSCQLKITEKFKNARFHLPSNFSVDDQVSKQS